jgi:endonuclease YncB( thermonuclease family)
MSGWENAPDDGGRGGPWRSAFAIIAAMVWTIGVATCVARAEPGARDVVGIASVIDGDTFEIHGERIRLSGIDAPEHNRRCGGVNVGQRAAQELDGLVEGRTLHCAVLSLDRYGRSVASCTIGDVDLAGIMVSQGWARDWPRYSNGAYADEQLVARRANRGVWSMGECAGLWGSRNYD